MASWDFYPGRLCRTPLGRGGHLPATSPSRPRADPEDPDDHNAPQVAAEPGPQEEQAQGRPNLLDLLPSLLLAYTDDLAVVAGEKQQLADYSTAVKDSSARYGLRLSTKTKFMVVSRDPTAPRHGNNIQVVEESYGRVPSFKYPGSIIEEHNNLDEEIPANYGNGFGKPLLSCKAMVKHGGPPKTARLRQPARPHGWSWVTPGYTCAAVCGRPQADAVSPRPAQASRLFKFKFSMTCIFY